MIHYVPGGLFELILPMWLIVKDSIHLQSFPSLSTPIMAVGPAFGSPPSQANKGLGMAFVESGGSAPPKCGIVCCGHPF
jgi:hypothetical protein